MKNKEQCRVVLEAYLEDLTSDDIIEKLIDFNSVNWLNDFVEYIQCNNIIHEVDGSE